MDIVKAIGIISIVMGHCCYSIMIPALNVSVGEFVYSYHLMVFFFVAGFFYKRGYHEHPEQYIGKRLLKLGGMLFLYNTVFTLLHNTLVSVKMISSTEHYSISKMVSCIVQSLLMKYTEELLGACWFLPMFFIGTALFAIAFSKAEKSKKPEYWHKIICILFAAVALCKQSGADLGILDTDFNSGGSDYVHWLLCKTEMGQTRQRDYLVWNYFKCCRDSWNLKSYAGKY